MVCNPQKLFFLDGAGALVTAASTGLVLAHYAEALGIPKQVLRGLGLAAVVFAVYSLCNFAFFTSGWRPRLAALAVANTVYGTVALGLVIYHRASVSGLAMAYFLIETAVVGALATVEWSVSTRHAQS